MGSITFLISAVMTIFVLNAFDEPGMKSAVDRLDESVKILAETAIDEGVNIDINQSLNATISGSAKIAQPTTSSRVKLSSTVSAI